jgi:peptidoglycan hydrolase FlgJ
MSADPSLITQAATAPSAPTIPGDATTAAAKKVGQEFESFFLSQVFQSMFSGVGTDALFGGGNGENVYRSLLLQEYSKVAAKSDPTGISADVTREVLRMQEAQGKKST